MDFLLHNRPLLQCRGEWEGLRVCVREGTNWISHAQEVTKTESQQHGCYMFLEARLGLLGPLGKEEEMACMLVHVLWGSEEQGARPAEERGFLAVTVPFSVS